MNKTELVNAMATKATMTKAGANAAVDAFTQIITERLQKGEKVSLIGFGTFETTERAGRIGRNPRTGEDVKIESHKVVRFKPGKPFKDAIN